jgi:hypothetical protein
MRKICSREHTILFIIFECLIRRRCYLLRLNVVFPYDIQNKRETVHDHMTLLRNGTSFAFICSKLHGKPYHINICLLLKFTLVQIKKNNFVNGAKVI